MESEIEKFYVDTLFLSDLPLKREMYPDYAKIPYNAVEYKFNPGFNIINSTQRCGFAGEVIAWGINIGLTITKEAFSSFHVANGPLLKYNVNIVTSTGNKGEYIFGDGIYHHYTKRRLVVANSTHTPEWGRKISMEASNEDELLALLDLARQFKLKVDLEFYQGERTDVIAYLRDRYGHIPNCSKGLSPYKRWVYSVLIQYHELNNGDVFVIIPPRIPASYWYYRLEKHKRNLRELFERLSTEKNIQLIYFEQ